MRALITLILTASLCGCASLPSSSAGHMVIPLTWHPDESQIARCEAALAKRVAKSDPKLLGKYVVRMYATSRDGRAIIAGYAEEEEARGSAGVLMPEPKENLKDPSFDPTLTLSWTAYFRFIYDSDADKLTQFVFRSPV